MENRMLELFGPRSRRQAAPIPQWKVSVLAVLEKMSKTSPSVLRRSILVAVLWGCGAILAGMFVYACAILVLGVGAK